MFTPEELAEMAAADQEIEETFHLTGEDMQLSLELDKAAYRDSLPNKERDALDKRRAYRERNREKVAAQKRTWRTVHRDRYNEYMRGYMRRWRSSE